MGGILSYTNGPGSSLSFLLASCCLPLRNENPSWNQTELDLNFTLSLSPAASYITSLNPNFLGVWEGIDHEPIKNTHVLSHCEARCWKQYLTSPYQVPFPFKEATHLLWRLTVRSQHGKTGMMQAGQKSFFWRAQSDWWVVAASSTLLRNKGREAQWALVQGLISNVWHGHDKVRGRKVENVCLNLS